MTWTIKVRGKVHKVCWPSNNFKAETVANVFRSRSRVVREKALAEKEFDVHVLACMQLLMSYAVQHYQSSLAG